MQLKKKVLASAVMAVSLSLVAFVGVSQQSTAMTVTQLSEAKPSALLSGRSQKDAMASNQSTIGKLFNYFFG